MKGVYLTRASSGCAAEENDGIMDGETSKCCEEIVFGRRLGAETTLRHWFVG